MEHSLTWKDIDAVAASLGVTIEARRKWRQRPAGVPHKQRIEIFEALKAAGREISFSAFDELPTSQSARSGILSTGTDATKAGTNQAV